MVNRWLAGLVLCLGVLLLAGCSSPTPETLAGTWIAEDLPGEPTVTFELGEYDPKTLDFGEVDFKGWPQEMFDDTSSVSIPEMGWDQAADWNGVWALKEGVLGLNFLTSPDGATGGGIFSVKDAPGWFPRCVNVTFFEKYEMDGQSFDLCKAD